MYSKRLYAFIFVNKYLFICFLLLFLRSSFAGGCLSGEEKKDSDLPYFKLNNSSDSSKKENHECLKKEDQQEASFPFDQLPRDLQLDIFYRVFSKHEFETQLMALKKNEKDKAIPIFFNTVEKGQLCIKKVGTILKNIEKTTAQGPVFQLALQEPLGKQYTIDLQSDRKDFHITSAALSKEGELAITWRDSITTDEYVSFVFFSSLKKHSVVSSLNLSDYAQVVAVKFLKKEEGNCLAIRNCYDRKNSIEGSLFNVDGTFAILSLQYVQRRLPVQKANFNDTMPEIYNITYISRQKEPFLAEFKMCKLLGIRTQSFADEWRKKQEASKKN